MNRSRKYSNKYILAAAIASIAGISMIIFPGVVLKSAQDGIDLWARTVLPALLPFFICTDFMISLGIPSVIGSYLKKPFQKAFGLPGSSGFVYIISISSGYPMGAKAIGHMRRNNHITDLEGIKMLSFCSTSGPLFMLGAVGVGMLNSFGAGLVIALSHYIASITNGFLFHILLGKGKASNDKPFRQEINFENESMANILTKSILSSLKALGIICCYIVIFTYLTNLLEVTRLLSCFSDPFSKGFIKGIIEITVGLNEMSMSGLIDLRLKTALAAFLVSFGGISIMAQSLSVLGNLKIKVSTYLFIKFTHAFMAGILAYILGPYILNVAVVDVALIDGLNRGLDLGFFMQLLFSTKMIIMIVLTFILITALESLSCRKDKDLE